MKTQSTEAERLQEQRTANRRRIAHYRAKQQRETVKQIQLEEVQLYLIPDSLFETPEFLRRQAD